MRFKFVFIFFVSLSFQYGWSQKIDPHSLAMGLQNGVATVGRFELKASSIALDLNHQRNLSRFFSWRTGLQGGYVFPSEYQIIDSIGNNAVDIATRVKEEYLQVNLTTMPVFYYREKDFSLFVGVGAGLGGQFQITSFYNTLYGGQLDGDPIHKGSSSSLIVGWKPVIGASFNLGSTRNENELEVMLSRESWIFPFGSFYNGTFYWYGLTLLYRHNFREG